MKPLSLAVLLTCTLLRSERSGAAEVIDPEEVVGSEEDEEVARHRGSWNADRPESLCAVDSGHAVSTIFWIPYAFHPSWYPCQGADRRSMTYEQFYRATGRQDLLERQDGRDRLKLGLFVAQIAAFVGGSVLTAVGLVESDVPVAVVGLSFIGGTLVLNVVSGAVPPLAVSLDEAQEAVRSFEAERPPAPRPLDAAPVSALVFPVFRAKF